MLVDEWHTKKNLNEKEKTGKTQKIKHFKIFDYNKTRGVKSVRVTS